MKFFNNRHRSRRATEARWKRISQTWDDQLNQWTTASSGTSAATGSATTRPPKSQGTPQNNKTPNPTPTDPVPTDPSTTDPSTPSDPSSELARWTLGSNGETLRDGIDMGGLGTEYSTRDGLISVKGVDGQWYDWINDGWQLGTPFSSDPSTPTDPSTPSDPSNPGTPVTPDPTDPSSPSTPSAPIVSSPDGLPSFSLQNTSSSAEGTGYVTFGQVFENGAVMPGETLVANINGQDVAVQMDVKTTNADGSVAHAILTLKAPEITAGGSVNGTLAKGSASTGSDIQAGDILAKGYNFKVDVTLNGSAKTIDAAQLLQQATASGNVETWMKGSQASEYRVSANVASNLDVKFDIRMNADGTTRTDVIFARDDAYTTDTSTLAYDVKFTQDGKEVFSQSNIQQYAYSTWHQAVSSEGSIDPHVVYDMAYLINTGAVPAYDLSTGVSDSAIASEVQALNAADTGPMGNALVQKYIPGTGGRADIGPETTWTATYLTSQNADAAKVMYANADASGSVPWHLIDTNGDPVRVDQRPNLWVDYRGTSGTDALPVTFDTTASGWALDIAHQPSLTYVPYLLSGDHYYLDELQAQASYTIASVDPGYRGQGDGVLSDLVTQIRGIAWGLRDISNAAYATPDGDAMKDYYTTVLNNNLDYLINRYVNGPEGDKEGATAGWINSNVTPDLAPWQQDYLATSLKYLADKGFTKADTVLDWMNNFVSGRFINQANGYDPLSGATYFLKTTDPATGQFYNTWAGIYQGTFGSAPATGIDGAAYPDWAGGYAANAKAAVAGMITTTQSPDAIEAYGWLQSQTTAMKESYKSDPTWNLAPKLANGEYLTNDEIFVSSNTAGATMTAAKDGNAMLIGNNGNDTITGGSDGISLLLGMGGNDTLKATSAGSILIGGDGDDRLEVAAAGTDDTHMTLKGGTGRDVFAFVAGAHATITDFKSGDDSIALSGVTASDVKVSSSNGSTIIDLTNNGRITLTGTTLSQSSLNISYA